MLPVSWTTIRLFIHVLAATVWVGGQLTLAGLVPGLRALGEDVPRTVARRFNRIAWPAFGVLVVTGIWNVIEVNPQFDTDYGRTVMVKVLLVTLAGLSAFIHGITRSKPMLAAFGALSALSSLGALFVGVQLH